MSGHQGGVGITTQTQDHRTWRWLLSVGMATMLVVSVLLVFLLALATSNQPRFEQYFEPLLRLNVAVASVLAAIVVWAVSRLVVRLRNGKFGSRLLLKLAAIFALVGFAPGVVIYTVSYQFVSRSIESWFNVQVEGALEAGLNLGRESMESLGAGLGSKALAAAKQLADQGEPSQWDLERLREQLGASDVVVWGGSAQVLASAGQSRFALSPLKPSAAQFRQARSMRVMSQIEGLEDAAESPGKEGGVRVMALAALPAFGLSIGSLAAPGSSAQLRYLQVSQAIPPSLVGNALAVQKAHQEYQQRALARDGLRNMYIATLTLSLFLAMFGAILLAAVLGNQLAKPLLVLADGVAQVAAGDLRPTPMLQTRDELGGLTRSFADMTAQIRHARDQLQSSRENLQTILDNITAAVIVLDDHGKVVQANPSADRILMTSMSQSVDLSLKDIPGLQEFGRGVEEQFRLHFVEQESRHQPWQHAFELQPATHTDTLAGQDRALSIIARGALLSDRLRLLVLDDITDIVSAQRSRAWGEVARRLAHEIKNPLTPIQLSAERLGIKLHGKLAPADSDLLDRSVQTIVQQVEGMKRLVNEFRDFARLPRAELRPVDLNQLITDLMGLYGAVPGGVPVYFSPDPSCPLIQADPQQLRQVAHNLIQNAQEACSGGEQSPGASEPVGAKVLVSTEYRPVSARVRLVIRDTGPGFAPHVLQRAFEPYVTTKARGTGLGLAVVKKIVDDHQARIELSNGATDATRGAQVLISLPVV